jgi:S1-C subfamily serine protease
LALIRLYIVLRTVGTVQREAQNKASQVRRQRKRLSLIAHGKACKVLMAENDLQIREERVCTVWQRMLEGVLGVCLLVGVGVMLRYYPAAQPRGLEMSDLQKNDLQRSDLQRHVLQLGREVQQLEQEQAMPALVLHRYRNSICYIFGVYQIGFRGRQPEFRARISGTGFVVSDGLLATNRHVAEPWYEDAESTSLIRKGATPRLEKLLAFFPGLPTPLNITPAVLSAQGDLAVLRIEDTQAVHQLRPLPLAADIPNPGELVAVVGYPMGVLGMVAKSPPAVYDRLAYRRDDQGAANELAALSLIRPSSTCGHLGDVVGDKLIYDAPTAHGGSGGPVFNSQGEVIGVNAAYIDGFSGGTLGVSVRALKPLIATAKLSPAKTNTAPAEVSQNQTSQLNNVPMSTDH